ncbi:hypothetical protein GCM10025867_21700 [Frondihabitans sucicola]|uniref:Glycoside hydrolase n=1 Tax=Frondihabitans sucicola TaxID=1268041 RepID=A0ABN6XYI1_9MICO|nr:glycosyl hydrolase family 8 [Frondihabitans sucicola]BDZ49929.1 hypothetical protein GCM10025867_21700 [Frondihabitans sucicola]
MAARTRALVASGVVLAVLVTAGIATLAVGGLPSGSSAETPSTSSATTTAGATSPRSATTIGKAFLSDYVDHDGADAGRVIRRDQGGDTVSEGQAYGLLVAAGVGDRKTFAEIWSWTKTNLERPDGLLAWRWDKGKVVDDMPASDADLDTARALVLAGKTFDDPAYTAAGSTLGGHILDHLTEETPDGRILLPGPWASGPGPWSYNPSYAAPATFALMASTTKDSRWKELETGSRAVTQKILQASALPSDWAQVRTDGSVVPLPSATGTAGTVQYGYDAGRLAVRYAESCSASDVALAAKLAAPLADKNPLPMQLDLGGTAMNTDQSPLGYVARAAARAAAGQQGAPPPTSGSPTTWHGRLPRTTGPPGTPSAPCTSRRAPWDPARPSPRRRLRKDSDMVSRFRAALAVTAVAALAVAGLAGCSGSSGTAAGPTATATATPHPGAAGAIQDPDTESLSYTPAAGTTPRGSRSRRSTSTAGSSTSRSALRASSIRPTRP